MSPSPVCASEEESLDIQTNFTMSGAELIANNSLSDFALVKLHNEIPSSWDVAFAGWDNTDNLPSMEVGIHHPNGDIMKICRDDSGAVKENANGTDVWLIGGVSVGTGDGWEIGTTESGSSGSPLFNEDGKIIGQLYAGQAFCDGVENNKDYDIYGRFGTSWEAGQTSSARLKDWLDPNNTGQTTTETLQNVLSTQEFDDTGTLDIYPNPATTTISIINNRYPNLEFCFYNLQGQKVYSGDMSNTINVINVEYLKEGIYFLYLLNVDTNISSTKKIIISR
jgi:lysyl endopeptidase